MFGGWLGQLGGARLGSLASFLDVYPEDLIPISIREGWVELRIHGVSGTPPEMLLRGHAIRVSGDELSGFYQRPGVIDLEAYSWGGLTSGAKRHALWVLLLPFSLINLAGWMTPPELSKGRERLHELLVRLLALAVTAITVLFAAVLILDIGAWRPPAPSGPPWASEALRWWSEVPANVRLAVAALLLPLTVLVLSGLGRQTRLKYEAAAAPESAHAPGDRGISVDPVSTASLDDRAMWGTTVVGDFLGAVHTAVGLGLVGMLAGWIAFEGPASTPFWIGAVAATLGTSLLFYVSLRPVGITTRFKGIPVAIGVVGSLWAFADLLNVTLQETGVPVVSPVYGFYVAVPVVLVLLGLLYLVGHSGKASGTRGHGFAVSGIALGGLASTGAGAVMLAEQLADRQRLDYAAFDWLAIVFTFSVALAISWAMLAWDPVGPRLPEDSERTRRRFERLRDTVRKAPLLVTLTGGSVVLGVVAALVLGWFFAPAPRLGRDWIRLPELTPGAFPLGDMSLGWLVLVLPPVVIVLQLFRHGYWRVLGLLALTAIVAWSVWDALPASTRVEPTLSFVEFSRYLGLFLPVVAVGVLIPRARSDRKVRQAVGIIWDVVNYWPRWYHPWAAPPYTEISIPALEARVTELVSRGRKVVLSGHSQGAVVSVPVLLQLSEEARRSVAFLSYGCLIGGLYRSLFPRYFSPECVVQLRGGLGGRWANLYRSTDPLGDEIPNVTRREPISFSIANSRRVLSHSDYQYSPEYQECLDEVTDFLAGPIPPPASSSLCGFRQGLWDGLSSPLTFVGSILTDATTVDKPAKVGIRYQVGYLLGVGMLLKGKQAKARRRARSR